MIKVIKKEDVARFLDDPKREYIDRRLGEMNQRVRILKTLIAEKPARKDLVLATLDDFRIQLEQAA